MSFETGAETRPRRHLDSYITSYQTSEGVRGRWEVFAIRIELLYRETSIILKCEITKVIDVRHVDKTFKDLKMELGLELHRGNLRDKQDSRRGGRIAVQGKKQNVT